MQAHYLEPVPLKNAAAVACLSESYFASLFQSYFGITLHRFVTELRIEKAKRELSLTDTPIKTLAHRAGYVSLHHFSRAFKQKTGFSPAAFRRLYTPVSIRESDEGVR